MTIRIFGIFIGIILLVTGAFLSARFNYSHFIAVSGAFIASTSIGSLIKFKKQSPTS
ncbi:hypothetical protein MOC18_06350 [Bacillus spizizenii]|nr:hypothetical protein [Bacillus spizizenii]MCY7805698.1 hypothetical protein [Bacillus spizizenii]MCY8211031.1 hypothetical protein [Bacillus spizizenii]MCY8891084.1 hypothetical protein [Bacillus spizizenii]MCY9233193.1 hypothetical protein [Bacillus spizizenii]